MEKVGLRAWAGAETLADALDRFNVPKEDLCERR